MSLLEDVIAELPEVAHAVVVGMPDERFGEAPVACVQPRAGRTLDFATLTAAFEAKGITKKFWPVRMEIVDARPIGPTGKIDRRMIVEAIAQRGSAR